jgi:hypothetical protein
LPALPLVWRSPAVAASADWPLEPGVMGHPLFVVDWMAFRSSALRDAPGDQEAVVMPYMLLE